MKVAIVYNRLYEFDGGSITIGGIQSYLLNLSELIYDMGWEPAIFQLGSVDFEGRLGNAAIIGKKGISLESASVEIGAFLSKCAGEWIGREEGLLIFGSDTYFSQPSLRSVSIQHGVFWDLPNEQMPGSVSRLAKLLPPSYGLKLRRLVKMVRLSRINSLRRTWITTGDKGAKVQAAINFMVCVDYNYLNVCKANNKAIPARTWVIPNFAQLVTEDEFAQKFAQTRPVKILFARRFVWYRGTRLVVPVFRQLLESCPNVHITFAGEGPDESFLRESFAHTDRVQFLKYSHDESTKILLAHDISVVPSLGSEGTSLSAIEAMAAGAVVVATCVGGLTNVITDEFNGLLVIPREDDLLQAILRVVTDPSLRKRLAENAYQTAKESLSLEIWRQKWRKVLEFMSCVNRN